MPLRIELRAAVLALADALDLVGVNDCNHGKRVAIMARETGRALGLTEERLDQLVFAGLLHDLGVSSTAAHRRLVVDAQGPEADAHCERAFRLLQPFDRLAALARPIRYHHTPWAMLPGGLEEADAIGANLICLADRVDALLMLGGLDNPLIHREPIRDEIGRRAGEAFAPEVAKAFAAAAANEAFWIGLAPRHVQLYLADLTLAPWRITIDFPQFRNVARLVSSIVDAKSPFTAAHSLGVAHLARHLGERLGMSEEAIAKVEVAGLMHDVGKLCVPDEIIDKPASLTRAEFSVMERHSFETYQILRHVPGLETTAEWAAFHHETLNGRGYPFHLGAEKLPLEARIVAVADVFQALAQTRPYRDAQSPEQIAAFLGEFVRNGALDPEVVHAACEDLEGAWQAASQMA